MYFDDFDDFADYGYDSGYDSYGDNEFEHFAVIGSSDCGDDNNELFIRNHVFKDYKPLRRRSFSDFEECFRDFEECNEKCYGEFIARSIKAKELVRDLGPFAYFPDDLSLLPHSFLQFYYWISIQFQEDYVQEPLISFQSVASLHQEWKTRQKIMAKSKKTRGNKRSNKRNKNKLENPSIAMKVDGLDPVAEVTSTGTSAGKTVVIYNNLKIKSVNCNLTLTGLVLDDASNYSVSPY